MFRIALPTLLAATIFTTCTTASTKPASLYDDRYYTNVRDFVRFMIHSSRDSAEFRLEDSVTKQSFPDGVEVCLKDSATFTDEERRQIRAWAAHPPFTAWTASLVPEAHLIRTDTISAIFTRSPEDGWSYIYDHFGPDFNSFGCPLFLRHYSWCLCYSANYCGLLCANGSLNLYQKEGDHWVVVKIWGQWIS
jgi:hypothetical protein